jgi:hypothetical protein
MNIGGKNPAHRKSANRYQQGEEMSRPEIG